MKRNGFVLGAALVALTAAAHAAAYSPTDVEWQKYGGAYDGLFTDVNHWKGGTAPSDYTHQAKFPAVASTAYTVTFPAGAYTNSAPVSAVLGANNSVTFSGLGTEWVIPGGDSDIHPANPFLLCENGYANFSLSLSEYNKQAIRFDDFSFTWSAETVGDKKHGLLDCTRGEYVFAAPTDGGYASLQSVVLNCKDNHNFTSIAYRFGANTTSAWPNVKMNFNATTNLLEFLGGSHRIYGALSFQNSQFGDATATKESYAGLRLANGASLTVDGTATLGANSGTNKNLHVDLDDATLTFNGDVAGNNSVGLRTMNFRAVNGSVLTFNGTTRILGGYDAQSGGLFVTNATVNLRNATVQFGSANATGASAPFRFEAKDSVIDHAAKKQSTLNGNSVATFVDCVWTNLCNKYIGSASCSSVPTVILKGGTSYNTEDIMMSSGCDSLIRIDGGYHRVNTTTFTVPYQAHTATIEVLDGTLYCDSAIKLGYRSGGTAILRLNGGVFAAPNLSSVTAGDRYLEADGGTWRVIGGGGAVTPLTGVTIGANGFTVDTNGKSITFDQDFTGTGALILTGGGTVTFTAGNQVSVPLVVRGGTKVVTNGVQPKGLTVGDDGTTCSLTLPANRTMALDGNLSVNVFDLAFSGGTYEKAAEPYDIFTVTGTITPGAQEAWIDATAATGIASDAASVFTVGGDGKSLQMTVRDPMTFTVTVPESTAVVTNRAIVIADGDTLVLDVGSGGSFSSDFTIKRGHLVKRGAGTVTLGCANNVFASAAVEAGELVLTHPGALGGVRVAMKGGSIRYAYEESATTDDGFYLDLPEPADRIGVCADVDVSVPLLSKKSGNTWLAQGGWTKSGPGAVAFRMPDEDARLSSIVSGTAALKIDEGEVAFRGTGTTRRELTYTYANPLIGSSSAAVSSAPSAPGLVVDHIELAMTGSAVSFSADGLPATAGNGYFYVTNNAAVSISSLCAGTVAGAARTGTNRLVVADNSSVSVGYRISAYASGGALAIDVLDNSSITIRDSDMRTDMQWRICGNSRFKGVDNGGFLNYSFSAGTFVHDWTIASGSTIWIRDIYYAKWHTEGLKCSSCVCNMTFDGGIWNPGKDSFTFDFPSITFNAFVKDAGLVLSPTNGQVWTVAMLMRDSAEGAGGLVKRGEGTVVLDAANLKYTGVTRLEAGTLDLNGSTAEGMTIQPAGGTLANATLVKPTYKLEVTDGGQAAVPATIDPTAVSGVVTFDLGRTEENPLTLPVAAFAVATYTGDDAPDISHWKVTGTGRSDAVGTLSVDPSTHEIRVAVSQLDGFFLFLQ